MQNKTTSQPENKQLSNNNIVGGKVQGYTVAPPNRKQALKCRCESLLQLLLCCCCCSCCCWQRAINFTWKNFVHLIFSSFNDILMRFENKQRSEPHPHTHKPTPMYTHTHTYTYIYSHNSQKSASAADTHTLAHSHWHTHVYQLIFMQFKVKHKAVPRLANVTYTQRACADHECCQTMLS